MVDVAHEGQVGRSIVRNIFSWLAGVIFRHLQRRVVAVREPDFIIGETARPYMLRWFVVPRNRWCNIYLHNIRRNDEDRALHDHPWRSLSLCLDGFVGEVYMRDGRQVSRVARKGDFVYRGSEFAHRLFLPAGPAWTLFVTGSRVREWGFHCPETSPAGGWRHWREFTAVTVDGVTGKGQIGRGCD